MESNATRPVSIVEAGIGGLEAHTLEINSDEPLFSTGIGVCRYKAPLNDGTTLESLIVNKGSDVLVVSFHGALVRKQYELPRFERLATLGESPYSSMYFSDPSLELDRKLELAWFVGPDSINVHELCAQWIRVAAAQLGCNKIIVSGSSGGGFAALQVATYLEDAVALAFNPQTELDQYFVKGDPTRLSAQKAFLRVVYPELYREIKDSLPAPWGAKLGRRASARSRYAAEVSNRVVYCTSPTDFHHEQHYLPFREAYLQGNAPESLKVIEYLDRPGHRPPSAQTFVEALTHAVEW